MSITPQQEEILKYLRCGDWVCGSTWLNHIKDDRKRLSELNHGYMKQRGYKIIGKRCDGRCGTNHSSTLFMRKAVKIEQDDMMATNAGRLAFFDSLST